MYPGATEDFVQRLTMLVTPEGRWVLPGSPEFLEVLDDPDPDYDAVAFAVKNLGFVKLDVIQESIAEIELHPRNVKLPALLAAQQQLLASRAKLFRIKYFDTAWHSEISSSIEHTMTRLSELCSPAFTPQQADRFVSEPRDYTELFSDPNNPLRLMAQKWRASFGQFDSTIISFAIQHGLLSRLMIVGLTPRDNDPVFRFIGEGFKWLDTDYQLRAIGEKLETLPDKSYGAWLSGFYKSVAQSGQPRFDCVTAEMKHVPGAGNAYATRYERLLLPWRTPSNEIFVSLSSRKLVPDTTESAGLLLTDSSSERKLAKSA